jgi:hypothetical protein
MPTDTPPGVVDYGTCWGHLGATYGWNSVAFFTPGTNLSISVSDVLFLSSVYYFCIFFSTGTVSFLPCVRPLLCVMMLSMLLAFWQALSSCCDYANGQSELRSPQRMNSLVARVACLSLRAVWLRPRSRPTPKQIIRTARRTCTVSRTTACGSCWPASRSRTACTTRRATSVRACAQTASTSAWVVGIAR